MGTHSIVVAESSWLYQSLPDGSMSSVASAQFPAAGPLALLGGVPLKKSFSETLVFFDFFLPFLLPIEPNALVYTPKLHYGFPLPAGEPSTNFSSVDIFDRVFDHVHGARELSCDRNRLTHIMPIFPPIMLCSSAPIHSQLPILCSPFW